MSFLKINNNNTNTELVEEANKLLDEGYYERKIYRWKNSLKFRY